MTNINFQWKTKKKLTVEIFTGGGNIVVGGNGGMPDCATGFPLNDDISLNVHPIEVYNYLLSCFQKNKLTNSVDLFFFSFLFKNAS